MNRFLHGVARATFETFPLPPPIVEIGSYQIPGQESLANLRHFFPTTPYLGVDVREGPGVDVVASVEQLPFPPRSAGTVLAFSTFEHVARFWRGFDEVQRILRPDGVFVVSCPFHFHIHDHPSDYWRFTPEAFKLLLADYPTKLLGWHGPATRPWNVWAIAFGPDHPGPTPTQIEQYKARLRLHAKEPMSLRRRLRYHLGRMLCGSRPFAPWLLRDAWHLDLVSSSSSSSFRGFPHAHQNPPHSLSLHRQLELPRAAPPLPRLPHPETPAPAPRGDRRR